MANQLQELYALLETIEMSEGNLLKVSELMRDIYKDNEELKEEVSRKVIQYVYTPQRKKRSIRKTILTHAEKCARDEYQACPVCDSVVKRNYVPIHMTKFKCFENTLKKETGRKKYPVFKYNKATQAVNGWLIGCKLDINKIQRVLKGEIVGHKIIIDMILWNINYAKMDKIYQELCSRTLTKRSF